MSTLDTVRGHPPTFVGAVSALLASLSRDFEPLVASLPVISQTTAQLALVLAAGLVGGAIGKWAERYTVAYDPKAGTLRKEAAASDDADLGELVADGESWEADEAATDL